MPALSPQSWEVLKAAGFIAALVAMIFVVNWRRKGHRRFLQEYAAQQVCPHLRPAFDLLKQRGHTVSRAGQFAPDYPLELHLAPRWDPKAVYQELDLQPPVYLSERNVLFCKECECELHPG